MLFLAYLDSPSNNMAVSKIGVLYVGVLMMKTLLFEVCTRPLNIQKLPNDEDPEFLHR